MNKHSSVFVQKLRATGGFVAALALFISPLGAGFSTMVAHAAGENPTTDVVTNVSISNATLNATNGSSDATGHSFWVSLSPIDTSSPTVPSGAYTTQDYGAVAASTAFSGSLTDAQGMPAVTPNTTYHYVAWSEVGGTWYPGNEQQFTTTAVDHSNVYVSTTGDDSHDGTSASPVKTIAAAIALVDAGGIVHVDAGTYDEQVTINKNLTLVGNGVGSTIIESPSSLPAEGAIVDIDGSGVSADISGVTVTGPGPAACGSLMSGIFVSGGAHASIHDLSVTSARDSSFSGCQNGRGILVGWGHGSTIANTTGSATVRNVTVSDYQKAGIEVSGAGSSATISDNTVTGVGSTGLIAQNGIEVTFGASANVSGNTVSANAYTGADLAAGILLYNPADSTVIGSNTVTGNQAGIWTNGQGSVGSINISGVTGNTRDALADSTGWTAPTTAYVDADWATKVADADGGDLVTSNGTTVVYGYNAFDTIKKGIAAVGDNSTVRVAAGTYNEDITVTHNGLTIVGAGSGSTIVNSDGGNGYGIYDYQHDDFNLSGITFNVSPTDAAIRYAFAASYADGVTLSHVIFNGAKYNAGGTASKNTIGGVDANTSSNISYSSVTSTGFYKNGFSFTPAYDLADVALAKDGITLNNITSTNNGWTGIAFYTVGHDNSPTSTGGSSSFSDVHLTGTNTISGNGVGIFVEGDNDANHTANSTTVAPVNTVTSDGTTLDLTHVDFSGNTLYDIENYQTAPVDAIGATFGGKLGDGMTSSEWASENVLIKDALDNAMLGMVTFHNPDVTAPVITVNGDATVTVEHASGYSDAGATAVDDVDGTVAVTTTGDSINTDVDGTYTVTYTATDGSGNTATSSRTVTVVTTNRGGGGGHSSSGSSGGSTGGSTGTGTGSTGTGNGGGEVLGASTFHFTADLTVGSHGDEVTQLQTVLIAAGYLHIGTPTGYFGPLTKAAVKLFQAAHGVPATGFVGPLTRAQLNLGSVVVTPTGTPDAALQAQLTALLAQLAALQAQLAASSSAAH